MFNKNINIHKKFLLDKNNSESLSKHNTNNNSKNSINNSDDDEDVEDEYDDLDDEQNTNSKTFKSDLNIDDKNLLAS